MGAAILRRHERHQTVSPLPCSSRTSIEPKQIHTRAHRLQLGHALPRRPPALPNSLDRLPGAGRNHLPHDALPSRDPFPGQSQPALHQHDAPLHWHQEIRHCEGRLAVCVRPAGCGGSRFCGPERGGLVE